MHKPNSTVDLKIPKTITPSSVWWWDAGLTITVFLILLLIFGLFWASILVGVGFGVAVLTEIIVIEMTDFRGALLFNPLNKTRRVVFPGFHFKLPWESLEEGSTENLKRVVSSTGIQNLSTNDPAENMEAHLTIHKKLDVFGTSGDEMDPAKAADHFIRFHYIEDEDLKIVVRKEIVKMFATYYASKGEKGEMENLLDPNLLQKTVLEIPENKAKIEDMENRWGISIDIILESSNADKPTKDLKRTPARGEAMRKTMQTLMEERDGVKGLGPEQARRAALSLDETADFREDHSTYDVEIHAPDLKNLRDVSIIPPGVLGGGKKEKGGKK